VRSGPYRLVRHPAYLGTLAGHLGFVLVFGHWFPLVVWIGVFVPTAIRRILVEEPLLLELDGYAKYAAGVRYRLVPGLW
jgi:protein-S-isoprenylcysteine O-methyltransferase Ste14